MYYCVGRVWMREIRTKMRPLCRPQGSREDNINIELKDTECENVDWI